MNQEQTILLVDDEVKITKVLEAYLEKSGYHTLSAHDGICAWELFQQHEISLVVLDLMLPDISGEELCRRIRTQSRVPIIMLTAKSEELDLLEGLRIGADDYLCWRIVHRRMPIILRWSIMEKGFHQKNCHRYLSGFIGWISHETKKPAEWESDYPSPKQLLRPIKAKLR